MVRYGLLRAEKARATNNQTTHIPSLVRPFDHLDLPEVSPVLHNGIFPVHKLIRALDHVQLLLPRNVRQQNTALPVVETLPYFYTDHTIRTDTDTIGINTAERRRQVHLSAWFHILCVRRRNTVLMAVLHVLYRDLHEETTIVFGGTAIKARQAITTGEIGEIIIRCDTGESLLEEGRRFGGFLRPYRKLHRDRWSLTDGTVRAECVDCK